MTNKTRTRRKDKNASLAKLTDPQFVTVVNTPANRTGFRMIRGDGDKKAIMEALTTAVRKRKRSDANLVSISLPTGIDRSTAEEVVALFALGDDYDLVEVGGNFVLQRKNSDGKQTFPVDMGDGFVANVDAAAMRRSDNVPPKADTGDPVPAQNVSLVRMAFTSDKFADYNGVVGWCTENGIECEPTDVVEDAEGNFSVSRYDTESETRTVSLGDGVTGYVIRAEMMDLPAPVAGSVISEAYGNWGWGQLDFSAAMADPKFTEQSWDALYVLRDVLENIVFYSSLPVDERKALVKGACDQYVAYMTQLIDALPKVVVEQVNNSDRKSKLEKVMKDQDQKAEGQAAPEQLTRSDVAEMITEAVTAALTAKTADEPVERSDDAPAEPVVEATAEPAPVDEPAKAERSDGIDQILDALKGVTERMDRMDDDLKGLQGTVDDTAVVRSDDSDAQVTHEPKEKKRNDSVFSGLFASLGV